jgi:peptidyl-prolyl cis-trans isomerase SurA
VRRLFLLLSIGCAAPHAAFAKTIDRIVAVVNDEIIFDTELEQQALPLLRAPVELDSAAGQKAWDDHKRKTLDQVVDHHLVLQQASDLKLAVTSGEVDNALEEVKRQNKLDDAGFTEALKSQGFTLEAYRKNLKQQILELKIINTAVRSRISISDEEVRAYYQQSGRQISGGATTAHLRQIVIEAPESASAQLVEEKRKVAAKVIEQARGGRSFSELAKAYSDDAGTKADGGDLGWIGPGMLVEPLDQVVAGMDPGDVRGPIRTGRGFYVLELVERKQGDIRPYEEVKEQLRRQLYDQQVEKASQSWIKELRKKAHVDVRY